MNKPRHEYFPLFDPFLKTPTSDQEQTHPPIPTKTIEDPSTSGEKLCDIFGGFIATLKEEAKRTKRLYEKSISPTETLEEVATKAHDKARETNHAT